MLSTLCFRALLLAVLPLSQAQSPKQDQLKESLIDTNGQIETTDTGVLDNTAYSLKTSRRGYNLLEDTTVRKKIIHFDHERAPERVVHALGHGAYGKFESYGDWSNLTAACWLQAGASSDVFTRFSVVVSSVGGSESERDTHGFATKIYSECGNQDLVGNHVPSFFINDGADFPDLVHAVKFEPDKGFPTDGSAHTTAYDFFTQHTEGTFQLMTVLSDLGIPRDIRHISGNGVHTYRFFDKNGKSTLFKWYWKPTLGHRALVYDEATKIAGKNPNFQRVDLYNNIEAGNYPEWEFQVQVFPDDGTYMWNGIDLLDPTIVIPFEMNPPLTLGKLTLNKNPTNFFAEPESISFAPSNVVKGVSFVPDPLLQWRLMSYDDTASHRHNSPNGYLLPINRAIAPINNNYRDGYMQPLLSEGSSTSSPDGIGGVIGAPLDAFSSDNGTLPYTGKTAETISGAIGRYPNLRDSFGQARAFWNTLDKYAQQHTVDAYRFELGNVASTTVVQRYVDTILNKVDNCLARRVAMGVGATLPAVGSGPSAQTNTTTSRVPSFYPLSQSYEPDKSNEGLAIGIIADETSLSTADLSTLVSSFTAEKVTYAVVSNHMGPLESGVTANQSFVTTSSIFYDAIIVVSAQSMGGGSDSSTSDGAGYANATSSSSSDTMTGSSLALFNMQQFVQEAYGHGKPIAAVGSAGMANLKMLGVDNVDANLGVYQGAPMDVAKSVLSALSGPVRFPQRFPVDNMSVCE